MTDIKKACYVSIYIADGRYIQYSTPTLTNPLSKQPSCFCMTLTVAVYVSCFLFLATAEHENMCIFKNLQRSQTADSSRGLSREEFEHLYENLGLKWEPVR